MENEILKQILEAQMQILQKVDSVEKKVDSLEKKVDSLEKKIDSLEKKVNSLEQRVGSVEQRVACIEREVKSLKAITLRMENEHGLKLTALFDGYSLNFDRNGKMDVRVTKLEREMEKVTFQVDYLKPATNY